MGQLRAKGRAGRTQPGVLVFSSEDLRSAVGLTSRQLTVRWPAVHEICCGNSMRIAMAVVVFALLTLPVRASHPSLARCRTVAVPG